MKRATSIISAFCLGLFISIGILACAVDDYATPNANNPSSDLQLCKMEQNYKWGYEHTNISYGNDGLISTLTNIYHSTAEVDAGHYETIFNFTYHQNKITLSCNGEETDFIFNNELRYYSAETINNQVFHCISILDIW